ncbi:MAG: sigma-E factor negative regulatory protein [Chromatiales bacterium]|jgi:sigma-E factor negative regulatory protein RseA|nr:sigma-E factor negative regulatory protein [Chromatiales bacterium]
MNRKSPDRISMLVDDELQAWEVKETLQDLMQDAEMQSCWRNYHLIGAAMRGHLISPAGIELSDRVAQALQHEPVYFSPRHPKTSVSGQTRTRTAVGFALAASLSAIAVIGVMQIGTQDAAEVSTPAPAQALAQNSDVPQNAPKYLYTFAADVSALPAVSTNMTEVPRAYAVVAANDESPNELAEYLLNYPHYAAANREQEDTLSYLRLVGYEQ